MKKGNEGKYKAQKKTILNVELKQKLTNIAWGFIPATVGIIIGFILAKLF